MGLAGAERSRAWPGGAERDREKLGGAERSRTEPSGSERAAAPAGQQWKPRGSRPGTPAGHLPWPSGGEWCTGLLLSAASPQRQTTTRSSPSDSPEHMLDPPGRSQEDS